MKWEDVVYQQYLSILKEELRPAMGCTEPIALAYAGAPEGMKATDKTILEIMLGEENARSC